MYFMLYLRIWCLKTQFLGQKTHFFFLSPPPLILCTIFTILLTLWNSEQKNGLLIKLFCFSSDFDETWWNCSTHWVLQLHQVSSNSDEKQKSFINSPWKLHFFLILAHYERPGWRNSKLVKFDSGLLWKSEKQSKRGACLKKKCLEAKTRNPNFFSKPPGGIFI